MALRQNALLLLLLTGLIAIAGDWSEQVAYARFWYAPAALLLLGLSYEAWIVGRALPRLELRVPSTWFLGRPTVVSLDVIHRLQRSLRFEIAPTAPPEVSMDRATRSIESGDAVTSATSFEATARRLGRHQWPAIRIRTGGVLGLAWWPRALQVDAPFRVVPDIVHESERALGVGERGEQAAMRSGSGAQILQLREYQPGDPPRSIDWKASARSRRLVSRDFSEDQQLDILLAVDAGRASGLAAGDTDRLALYANVAARLAQRAVTLDDRVGLLIYAERPLAAIAPGHGDSAVMRIRAALSMMSVQPADSNPALAALRLRSLVRHRSLIVMLTDLDDASVTGELRVAIRLLLPKHLPFIAGVASERVRALGHARASDEADVYRSLAAQEYYNTLQRNVASLRALGAPAVLASPGELDQAVLRAYISFRRRRRV
jgi:uncharacterized protein (DUF58 family)